MTGITGVSFDEAWSDRHLAQFSGSQVPFLSPKILFAKRAAGRAQDLADVSSLEKALAKAK